MVVELKDQDDTRQPSKLAQEILERNSKEAGLSDSVERWDYVSPGLKRVRPDSLFPNLNVGNTSDNDWEFLRREVPHTWYVDRRFPVMGFLSRDEAAIVHNLALLFKGRPALEVGCWRAWSSAHILKAGVHLDIVDPILAEADSYLEIEAVVRGCKAIKTTTLNPGMSENRVEELAADGKRWNFIFIDGDHEFPAPAQDAEICAQFAADDCIMVFHDLASPATAQGLETMRRLGWNTVVYQTMQIIGVAWRGNVEPVAHTPDPKVNWRLPQHLRSFRLIHENDDDFAGRKEELLIELLDTENRYQNAVSLVSEMSSAKSVWKKSSKDWQENAENWRENAENWQAEAGNWKTRFMETKATLDSLKDQPHVKIVDRLKSIAKFRR